MKEQLEERIKLSEFQAQAVYLYLHEDGKIRFI